MKATVTGLALVFSVGCAATDAPTQKDCSLPGDVDCAPPSSDGKADGWNNVNDPSVMAQRLNYRLAELPMKGWRNTPVWKDTYPEAVGKSATVWADTYWPTSEGSHNNRWQGASIKSPLEKYDVAFNGAAGCDTQPAMYGAGAKAAWDTYGQCAGPAAKWQSNEFQGDGQMHDGVDNDNDGVTDDQGTDGIDGVQGWWGTCHAWTPASELVPEPQHAVTLNGVTFEVGDIKALIQNSFDTTSAVMLGGRCNDKEITHTVTGSANDACSDVNPGALHVVMTNFLGLQQLPLIEDRTANYEVWNQPVVGYEITKQDPVNATQANACVGATGDKWTYNPSAASLYEVRMTVSYVTEAYPSTTPVGYQDNVRTDDYHYILEVGSDGKVLGGRYCSDADNNHIDFLWSPTGSFAPSNPYVDVEKVKQLIKLSVGPDQGSTGGNTGGNTTGTTKDFSATPNEAIPDADATGIFVDVPVSGVTNPKGLSVSVDITHTYRGDLTVTLWKDGNLVSTLVQSDETDNNANLVGTYTVDPSTFPADPNGNWSVGVADLGPGDTGTVNSVKLSFSF